MNAEFQRIARRDTKDFLCDQCKTIEEKTEWERLEKMGSIKDRNRRDLREAEDIKRLGKNTQKNCTKSIFKTQTIMMV